MTSVVIKELDLETPDQKASMVVKYDDRSWYVDARLVHLHMTTIANCSDVICSADSESVDNFDVSVYKPDLTQLGHLLSAKETMFDTPDVIAYILGHLYRATPCREPPPVAQLLDAARFFGYQGLMNELDHTISSSRIDLKTKIDIASHFDLTMTWNTLLAEVRRPDVRPDLREALSQSVATVDRKLELALAAL